MYDINFIQWLKLRMSLLKCMKGGVKLIITKLIYYINTKMKVKHQIQSISTFTCHTVFNKNTILDPNIY